MDATRRAEGVRTRNVNRQLKWIEKELLRAPKYIFTDEILTSEAAKKLNAHGYTHEFANRYVLSQKPVDTQENNNTVTTREIKSPFEQIFFLMIGFMIGISSALLFYYRILSTHENNHQ